MIKLKSSLLLLTFSVIISSQFVTCDNEQGFFTVVGSNLMRFRETYRVSVTYQGYKSEKVLQIGIKSSERKDDDFMVFDADTTTKKPDLPSKFTSFQNVTLLGDGVQQIDIDLSGQHESDYILEVKSITGDEFSSIKKLHMNMKKFSVFVQTDKSIYKPSDKVKFRVLILDADTKPFTFETCEIFITDGADNRVKQFDHPERNFVKGVYENDLQLSDLPVMGSWKIHIKVNGEETAIKSFDVAEYVLPKFQVTIDANPDANFKEGIIRATVKATYTFGKIAKGNATVVATVENPYRYHHWRMKPTIAKIVSKTVAVDGKKFVEFDIKKDLGMEEDSYNRNVKLFATFTDELSGKEANATARVEVHKTPHKMELSKSAEKIKPGLPFKVTADIRFHDKNTPVTDKFNPVNFTISYFYDVPKTCKRRIWPSWRPYRPIPVVLERKNLDGSEPDSEQETTTEEILTTTAPVVRYEEYECREEKSYENSTQVPLKNGMADIDIEIPSNTTHIRVRASYLSNQESIYHITKDESANNEFIQAKLMTEKPSLSNKLTINVLSTTDITQLTYEIFGRGSLVETKTVKFEATKDYMLEIIPHMSMLPKAQIVIFYINKDGEIISDRVDAEFGSEFKNHMNIKLSTKQAKPGENLTISVEAQPNSFVGLLGVDQSVLLLKKGNDIESSIVSEELRKFGEVDKYNHDWYGQHEYEKSYEDFLSLDAVIITNAKKPFQSPYVPYFYDNDHPVYYSEMARPMAVSLSADTLDSGTIHLTTTANRVMEAAPQAAFSGSSGVGGAPISPKPIEIRKTFPETWMFDSLDLDSSSSKTITKKVPDTITSWIITGFSLDPLTGLGLTKQPSKLNVFQPFFVSTNLPYSIKRGEVVSIPIIIFNYLESDQLTSVTLSNADRDFEFVEINDDENDLGNNGRRRKRGLEVERKKQVLVKSDEGVSVPFMIRPLKAGQITIKVTAESDMAGDGVERMLKVEPEGVTQFLNEAVLIDLRTEKEFKKTIEIQVPDEAVPDSTRVEASAIGDVLGPSIENLDKLIKLPYGCGEQNMLNFVPNIVVLEYLTKLNKLSPSIEEKAKKYMETGYQRELTYKHNDGSYSAFGKSDRSGSTWLTAFVAKSFHQASKFIDVDRTVIEEALDFLTSVQAENGSFPEVGHVSHSDMQGGSSKGLALTAYTLITFLEMNDTKKYETTVDKAVSYISKNLDQLDDTYSLAIAAYAMQLAGHESRQELLSKLTSKADVKDGMKFWMKSVPVDDDKASWWHRPCSVNVEMTAYALQAFLASDGQDNEAVPIMKWLVTQRNENGGFQSTQDTVVGLQALAKLATKIHVTDSDLTVTVKPDVAGQSPVIKVNDGNSLILQKHELPATARTFEVEATGRGFSILQISYRYNLDNSTKFPRFQLIPKVGESSNKEFLNLIVCTRFVPDSQAERSNMAVMEVALPSGFTFDNDHLPELMNTEKVKKVETKDSETVVMVYFDDIGSNEICPEFKAYRTHSVAKQKPAPVIIYDYYDNSRHARAFFSPPEISLCDICEGADDCRDACESPTVDIV